MINDKISTNRLMMRVIKRKKNSQVCSGKKSKTKKNNNIRKQI